jgi:hypothetical protein
MSTYSFLDATASLVGPGVNVNLGPGSANAEGGITITPVEDVNAMSVGADGYVMHSLHAGSPSIVTVRLQKTSATNQVLSDAYAEQRTSSALHGFNTITIRDLARGDHITCTDVAFARQPDVNYAKDGGEMAWVFHAGKTSVKLGRGISVAA